MTKQELIKMVGNEDNADAGMEKCRIANNLLLERNRISTILYHD